MDEVNRKRGKFEAIYDILKTIQDNNNSIKPTPLMRSSNLSSKNFSDYIFELKEKGLVKELSSKDGRKYFTLSDLGFKYVEKYKHILGFFEEFNL